MFLRCVAHQRAKVAAAKAAGREVFQWGSSPEVDASFYRDAVIVLQRAPDAGDEKAWESVVFYFVWFDLRELEDDGMEEEPLPELLVQPITGTSRAAEKMHRMRGGDSNVAAEMCYPWTVNRGDLIPPPHPPMTRLERLKSGLRW
jgi:hypothetical protein